ncbi:uncharacterized protein LOC143020274 [Oratosquilla oratoria]|uniref:uncharacterized protein LOC143020274 n=1 Tax=Oratosquilla oratoria TaxID=337810 RepID=UPI003F77520C
MKSALIVLAVAFVLNESCSGVTARLTRQRQKREFVMPPNRDEILDGIKYETDPETRKNVTEEEDKAACDSHDRKELEAVLLCEELTRPVFEQCFKDTGLLDTLPFVSSRADFIDALPMMSVLKLLRDDLKHFQYSDYENEILLFDVAVLAKDLENNGNIGVCIQQNMVNDFDADCDAAQSFKCYMDFCIISMLENTGFRRFALS